MTRLSDELLDWILSPPLLVPDELFADPGPISPFSRATYSASDVLLVCKSWMRVATPALYATVVIRSTAQAQALAQALSRNPEFARFVKKLRIEGAYGKYLRQFIPLMTNVTDFCFALSVRSSDDIGGLALALKTFNPTRVILTLPPLKHNNKYRALIAKLATAVANWTHLTHFCFTRGSDNHARECDASSSLIDALSNLRSLGTVHYRLQERYSSPSPVAVFCIATLLYNPSISSLVLHCASDHIPYRESFPSWDDAMFRRLYVLPLGAKHPLKVRPKAEMMQAPATILNNPFYRPLHDLTSEARIDIWRKIFDFAIARQPGRSSSWMFNYDFVDYSCFTGLLVNKSVVRSLLLVCREFSTAVLRAVCRHVVIKRTDRLRTLHNVLQRASSSGRWVETIKLQHDPDFYPQDLEPVFQVTTGVRLFSADSFNPHLFPVFPTLFHSAGHTIQTLVLVDRARLTRGSGITSPLLYTGDVFKDLVAVEVLEWDVEHISFDATDVADLFPKLRQLSLRRSHITFVELLANCSLPQLSQLALGKGFLNGAALLNRHGSKILHLSTDIGLLSDELDACPALVTLEVSENVTSSAIYGLSHAHLQTIRLHWLTCGATSLNRYKTLGQKISRERLPSLREVVVMDKANIWPLTETEIRRSPWPNIAESFLQHSVSLLDYTCRKWRPRLKVK